VDSDQSFRESSNKNNEGVVTYEQAAQKVKEAHAAGVPGMSESDFFRSYSRLVEMAEEMNQEAVARGETMLSITIKVGEKDVAITGINIVLPTKKAENDNDIVVMKKGLM